MAQQLIQMRTPEAYAGVEAYARKHAGTDAGALANLALGYAHLLDKDYDKALVSLEKAKRRAGELADYVRFFEAQAQSGNAKSEQVLATLKDFTRNSADSIFLRDAELIYSNALTAQGHPEEAVKYLEANRTPTRADIELALGKAYIRAGDAPKGMSILRRIYFTMPLSSQAGQAAAEMQALGSSLEGSFEERRLRAELLGRGNRWTDAAKEYRDLLNVAPEHEKANLQVALAVALRKSGNTSESKTLFESAQATGEANAQRLYWTGEDARNRDDVDAVMKNLERMRAETPASTWLQQALLSAGNMYLLKKDYDRAIDMYREISVRFPTGRMSSYAHWKATWLNYRLRRTDAKKELERQVEQYPDGNEVAQAVYWRARLAEQDGDVLMARAWYTKCANRFRNYYYGYLSRERLAKLPPPQSHVAPLDDPLLAKIPEPSALEEEANVTTPPSDDLRVEKAKLLENAGLTDFAVKELQAAGGGDGPNWATLEIARVYRDGGMPHRALQFLKRAVPSYYAMDIADLPRAYWDLLFPTPYWGDLRRYSSDVGLDPYLVASLIRQESEFNPGAVSHANAWGLMQLLPTVGKGEAKAAKVSGFRTESLLNPTINIQLGTRYFRAMVDRFGQVEYALAAYNAGASRVDEWKANGQYNDIDEFVESIPFTETREYVQAIVRNAQVYKKLFPGGETASVSKPSGGKSNAAQ